MAELSLTDRILAVLDALDVRRVHIATQYAADVGHLIAGHSERVGRVVLAAPSRVEIPHFAPLGGELLFIEPTGGMLARTAESALPMLPDAARATLDGYAAEAWSDLAGDRPDIVGLIAGHVEGGEKLPALSGPAEEGEIAGVRYRASGAGQPLLLTPMVLSPTQWRPVIEQLEQRFRVIELAGPQLGMLSLLEERAACADWRHMCAGVFDGLDLRPGERVLDVGCGAGAVALQFARRTDGLNPLTALDLSPYFIGEARIASAKEPLAGAIEFVEASAEELPYPDDAFDAAYSITVLEECDAEKALAELARVVKPGGRVAVVVRGTDMPTWWNMALPESIVEKIRMPAASRSPAGVADRRLYDMAGRAGLKPVRAYAFFIAAENGDGPSFTYAASHALGQLDEAEKAGFQAARASAQAAGVLYYTRGHHCFVGEVA